MNSTELTIAISAIESLLLANRGGDADLIPILIGIDQPTADSLMPSLIEWRNKQLADGTIRPDPLGRSTPIAIPTTGRAVSDVLRDFRNIRRQYSECDYICGPVVLLPELPDKSPYPLKSIADCQDRAFDTYASIAFAIEANQFPLYLACHEQDLYQVELVNRLSDYKVSPDRLGKGWGPDSVRDIAPSLSITFFAPSSPGVVVLEFSRSYYYLTGSEQSCIDSPIQAIDTERVIDGKYKPTPMYTASQLESINPSEVHLEVERILGVSSGTHPRSDSDYLVNIGKSALKMQWIAKDAVSDVAYSADTSKFGLAVAELAEFVGGSVTVLYGGRAANSSQSQIAVSLGPASILKAYRLPSNRLPDESSFLCFSVERLSPEFVVEFLNAPEVRNSIIARSAGPWRNPILNRQTILSVLIPAVTPNEYKVLSTRIDKIDSDRRSLEDIADSLEDIANRIRQIVTWHQGDSFALGDLEMAIDPNCARPMYKEAAKILLDLGKIVRPSQSSVLYPPFPIAVAFRSIENSVSNIERLKRLFEASETFCRTMCFLLAAERVGNMQFDFIRRKLDGRGSFLMTFGEWVYWLRSLRDQLTTLSSNDQKKIFECLDQIVRMRNEFSHGTAPSDAGVYAVVQEVEGLFESLSNLLPEATGALWVYGTEVIKRRDGATWVGYSLNGDHPDFQRQKLDLPSSDERIGFPAEEVHSFYGDRWKSLWPWIILDRDQEGRRRLFWWDGLSARGDAKYTPIGTQGKAIYRELEGREIRSMILQE